MYMRTKHITRTLITITTAIFLAVGAARVNAQGTCVQTLYGAITNKIANPGNATPLQIRALGRAKLFLERGTNNLNAELRALAITSALLERSFRNDTDITNGFAQAVSCYHGEINGRLDALAAHVASLAPSGLQRAASNQVRQAAVALDRASTASSAAAASRFFSLALVKIRVGNILADRAEFAPTSIAGKTFVVGTVSPTTERGTEVATFTDTMYTIPAHGTVAEETGTYTYNKTASNAATLVLTPTTGAGTSVELAFSSKNTGTFTATGGAPVSTSTGRFRIL